MPAGPLLTCGADVRRRLGVLYIPGLYRQHTRKHGPCHTPHGKYTILEAKLNLGPQPCRARLRRPLFREGRLIERLRVVDGKHGLRHVLRGNLQQPLAFLGRGNLQAWGSRIAACNSNRGFDEACAPAAAPAPSGHPRHRVASAGRIGDSRSPRMASCHRAPRRRRRAPS